MRASMVAVILYIGLVFGVGTAEAQDKKLELGGVKVTVPAPSGFIDASVVSPEVMRLFEVWTPPENRLLTVFASEQDIVRMFAGESPLFDRYMLVQILRANEHASFSAAEYRLMANLVRDQHGTIVSLSEGKADRLVQKGAKQVSEEFDVALDMKLGEVRTLGVFLDQPRAISFANIVKYDTKVEGDQADHIVAGTTSFILANGKLLFLYVYRNFDSQGDLDWVRQATHDWIGKIQAANE